MRTILLVLAACVVSGCAMRNGTLTGSPARSPLVLKPGFEPSQIQNVALFIDFPNTDAVSGEEAKAFVEAVQNEVERRWMLFGEARLGVRQGLNFETNTTDIVKELHLQPGEDWLLVAQLDAHHTFAEAPKADFRETGGVVLRDGTRIPNPTICLVVVVRCALLDAKRSEVVWMDKQEMGPVIRGYPMEYKHMTPELILKMTKATFQSLPRASK